MFCVRASDGIRLGDVAGTSRSARRNGTEAPRVGLRQARWGTSTAFLLTGFVFATWAARIPALKANLGLTDAQLAVALVGLNAGAVVGLQLGSVVVTRLGSRRTLLVALPAFAGALLPIGLATSLAMLTVAVAVSAGINSVVDIAINDQGVGVEHGYERSLLTGMHAMHSLGGVIGGAVAAVACARRTRPRLPLLDRGGRCRRRRLAEQPAAAAT